MTVFFDHFVRPSGLILIERISCKGSVRAQRKQVSVREDPFRPLLTWLDHDADATVRAVLDQARNAKRCERLGNRRAREHEVWKPVWAVHHLLFGRSERGIHDVL